MMIFSKRYACGHMKSIAACDSASDTALDDWLKAEKEIKAKHVKKDLTKTGI